MNWSVVTMSLCRKYLKTLLKKNLILIMVNVSRGYIMMYVLNKCKLENIMTKHMTTKHRNINNSTLCGVMFEEETLLKVHTEKDNNNYVNIISEEGIVTRMEQLQREVNDE